MLTLKNLTKVSVYTENDKGELNKTDTLLAMQNTSDKQVLF